MIKLSVLVVGASDSKVCDMRVWLAFSEVGVVYCSSVDQALWLLAHHSHFDATVVAAEDPLSAVRILIARNYTHGRLFAVVTTDQAAQLPDKPVVIPLPRDSVLDVMKALAPAIADLIFVKSQ